MDNYNDIPRCYEVITTPRPPSPPPPPSRRLRRRRDTDGKVLSRSKRNISMESTSKLDHGPGPIRSSLRKRASRKSYARSFSEISDSSDASQRSTCVHPPYSDYSSSDEELTNTHYDTEEEAEVARVLDQIIPPTQICSSHFEPMSSLVPASLGTLLVHNVLDKLHLLPPAQPVQRTHRPSHMPRVRPTMPLNRHGNPLYPPSLRPYIIEEDDAEYRITSHDGKSQVSIPLSRNHFDHCLARHTSKMLRIYRVPVERSCKYETICARYGLVARQISKPEQSDDRISLWMQGYEVKLEQLESESEREDCWMLVAGKLRMREFEDIQACKKWKNRSCASKIMDATTTAASRMYGSFLRS